MDTLDEDDLFLRPLGVTSDQQPPGQDGRTGRLRPVVITLGVVVAGAALGTVGYFLTRPQPVTEVEAGPATATTFGGPFLSYRMPDRSPPPGVDTPAAIAAPATPSAPPPTLAAPPVAAPSPTGQSGAPVVIGQSGAGGPVQPLPRPADAVPSYGALPDVVQHAKPLSEAPAAGLTRSTADGALPVVGADGRQPWQVYARPFEAKTPKPRLAVVVTGLGLDTDATNAAIERLPADVTLAFSPYAGGLEQWVKKARDAGHEVLLALPMEESGYPGRDPGPWALISTAKPEDNAARLRKVLGRAVGYVGVLGSEGPFSRSRELYPILAMLRERGLIYVGPGTETEAQPLALPLGAVLDGAGFRDFIDSREKAAPAQARGAGRLVAAISARPVSLERLAPWLPSLPAEGVDLAPVTALIAREGSS